MSLIDLTNNFTGERHQPEIRRNEVHLKSGLTEYTGVVYSMNHSSMTGSYIDFPGHIAETDNGIYADNCPLEDIFRIKSRVIHLNFNDGDGAVSGKVLKEACPEDDKCQALIINALGKHDFFDIEDRSVYLDESAVDWIISSNYRLLVSDIYESQELHGVFLKLFAAGITTVCRPVNLYKLPSGTVELTVLFAKIRQVTQLPCRIVAEF